MIQIVPLNLQSRMKEKVQPGAFVGVTLITHAVSNTALVYHGVSGCNIMTTHYRSDLIPNGTYTPIIPTGFFENETIMGGGHKLEQTLRDIIGGEHALVRRRPDCLWVTVSDAASIAGEEIEGISRLVSEETGVPIIAIDAAGFRGGVARGAELALCAIIDRLAKPYDGPKVGVNLIAPFLMGSANWPFDIDHMAEMLEAADVKVNLVLSRNLTLSDLERFAQAEANYLLAYEEMPDLAKRSEELGMEMYCPDLPLPYGLANTERWYLAVSKRFGDVQKAKQYLAKEMGQVQRLLRQNYNFSWMASMLSDKYAAVCGPAPFAVALTHYLFHDLNIRVKVVGLWGETEQGVTSARKLLEPLSSYLDFVVMEDPPLYQLGQTIRQADVDFVIGSMQDKPLFGSLGLPHLNLAGFYYFNNYNFVPWPLTGVKGSLRLFSELCRVAQEAFFETEAWRRQAYQPRPDGNGNDGASA